MATTRALSVPANTLTEQKYVSSILNYGLQENLRGMALPQQEINQWATSEDETRIEFR